MGRFISVTCIVCFFSVVMMSSKCVAVGEAKTEKTIEIEWLDGLRSEKVGSRVEARDEAEKTRKAIINRLIEIAKAEKVGGTSFESSKRLAIELLGKYRAEEAVDFLFSILLYEERPTFSWGAVVQENKYPAVGALIKIGIPAAKKAWPHLSSTEDAKELDLCFWIIVRVYGKDVARLIVEDKLKRATSQPRKRNLEKGLKEYLAADE